MSPTTPLSPEPQIPSPPSTRDFEIHRLALVEFLSTRRIAEKFHISQTRVRQIIARVADWITEMLPLKSEADIEKEKRYAIHLAAAQLQNQIEHLQYHWDGSSDPKFLRQQTRAILALARLGVASHHLDSLSANVFDEALPTQTRRASEDSDVPHPTAPETAAASPSVSPSLHPSVTPSQIPNLKSEIPNSSPPPSEDCSPNNASASISAAASPNYVAATPCAPTDLLLQPNVAKDTLNGLDIQEQRLLTIIDQTYPDQTDRLHCLHETLAELRQARASFILQLSPHSLVAPLAASPTHIPQQRSLAST